MPHHLSAINFLGLSEENQRFADSAALILPIPYEATVSYGSGTKAGPQAILNASTQVELYDIELGFEPALRWGIHTLPALAPEFAGSEAMMHTIAEAAAHYASSGKLLVGLGGEHTVSVGMARGLAEVTGEFVTVQLDAHADLRDSYDGTPYSHACTARRILETSPIIQLGIRSLDVSEADFLRSAGERVTSVSCESMHADKGYLDALTESVRGRNVFLTIDLDVFDPAVLPAVGTPEPDGLSWRQGIEIIRTVNDAARIIAFDCVELAPIPGQHASDFAAAKLIYKTISLILANGEGRLPAIK